MEWLIGLIVGYIAYALFTRGSNKKVAGKQGAASIAQQRNMAERHIMQSGDQKAIAALKRARANPTLYCKTLAREARDGNDTLRTALGVLAGGAIAGMVFHAMDDDASKLEEMQHQLNALESSSEQELHADADEDEDEEEIYDSSDFDIGSVDGFESADGFDGDAFEQEAYDGESDCFDEGVEEG